jgi:ribosome-associated protein
MSETEKSVIDGLELAQFIVAALEDKKAGEILLLDLGRETIVADYFIICSANSDRQAKALADAVRERVKEEHKRLPFAIEGAANSGWVLLDYGNVVVHVFLEEERRYYNLEGLWNQATVLLTIQ